ncbi:hypothetical protein [Neobacillus sp. D3-1R]|uniref:hypothetical protein n=1 Tax=Neobacillus sp. D3-1R TaxID=3445778 RepID=UPI003FA05B00
MNQPDYRDFYPKSLIPIGVNDQAALELIPSYTKSFQATHWLVALQAKVKPESEETYHWQVYLFPTDLEGSYTWSNPLLISKFVNSIDEALEMSNELETYGRDDSIISSKYIERIS